MNQRKIGIIVSYANTILSTVIGFVLSVFILRKMGADEYGVYQMMSAFANYLVLLEFGIGTVMTRNIAQSRVKENPHEEANKQFVSIFTVSIGLSLVILLLSFVFYKCIDVIYVNSMTTEELAYGKQVFIIITFYLVVSFLSEAFNGLIQGYERFLFSKAAALIKLVVRTGIVLLVFFWSPHAVTLAIIDLVVSLIYTIINAIFCRSQFSLRFKFKYFDKRIIIAILPYALALLMQSVVNQANNNVDKFLIGIMMNPVSVSVYSIGLFIFSSYSSMSIIPISLYLPKIVMDIENGMDEERLTVSVIEPSRLITLIGGAIMFGFIAIGKKFICVFYGTDYWEAYYIALIIMIPMFLNMATGILINVLDAKGKRLSRSIVLLITTIANIGLTLVFIPLWGIIGAAVATAICTMIGQVIVMNIYYKKVLHINVILLYRESFRGLLLSMVIPCLVVLPVSRYLPYSVWAVFLECITFIIILLGFLMAFGLNTAEKQMIKAKINTITKRKVK